MLPKIVQRMSQKYDTSPLAKLVMMTVFRDQSLEIENARPILKSMLKDQLKTTFVLVKTVAFEGIQE